MRLEFFCADLACRLFGFVWIFKYYIWHSMLCVWLIMSDIAWQDVVRNDLRQSLAKMILLKLVKFLDGFEHKWYHTLIDIGFQTDMPNALRQNEFFICVKNFQNFFEKCPKILFIIFFMCYNEFVKLSEVYYVK